MALRDYAGQITDLATQKPYKERQAEKEYKAMEQAFKKKKLLFDTEKMEAERKETERKNKLLGARDSLGKMEADLDGLLSNGVLNDAGRNEKIKELAAQYEDPRLQALFVKAATTGDPTIIDQAQELADQQLVRSGYLKPEEKKPRALFVAKSGKVIYAPDDDPRIERPLTRAEQDVGAKMGGFSQFGSDAWMKEVNPTRVDEVVEVQDPKDLTKTLMVPKDQAANYRPASNATAARNDLKELERQKIDQQKEINKAEKDLNEAYGDVQGTIALNDQFFAALSDPNLAGAVGLADQYTGAIGAQFGSEEGVLGKRLLRLSSELVLEAAGNLKGALSDRDIKFLQDTQPKLSDGPAVWRDWYNNNWLPKYNAALKKYTAEKKRVDAMKGGTDIDAKLEEIRAKYGQG